MSRLTLYVSVLVPGLVVLMTIMVSIAVSQLQNTRNELEIAQTVDFRQKLRHWQMTVGSERPKDVPSSHEFNSQLTSWLVRHGAVLDAAELAFFRYASDTLRGLRATRDLAPGDLIASIPMETVVSEDALMLDDAFRPLFTEKWLDPKYRVVVWLVYEARKVQSPWGPYIDALFDSSFHSLPVLYSEERLANESWRIKFLVKHQLADVQEAYQNIFPRIYDQPSSLFDPHQPVTFDEFHWAALVVGTRHWTEPIADQNGRETYFLQETQPVEARPVESTLLLPYFDMLNFGDMEVLLHVNTKLRVFELRAGKPIKRHEELLFFYQLMCRDVATVLYGIHESSHFQEKCV